MLTVPGSSFVAPVLLWPSPLTAMTWLSAGCALASRSVALPARHGSTAPCLGPDQAWQEGPRALRGCSFHLQGFPRWSQVQSD